MPQPKCLRKVFRGGTPAYRVYMYPEAMDRHHEPHVHIVWGDNDEVVIALHNLHILEPLHLTRKFPLKAVLTLLEEHRSALLEEWEEFVKRDYDNTEL